MTAAIMKIQKLIERRNKVATTGMGNIANKGKQICLYVGVRLFVLQQSSQDLVKRPWSDSYF